VNILKYFAPFRFDIF